MSNVSLQKWNQRYIFPFQIYSQRTYNVHINFHSDSYLFAVHSTSSHLYPGNKIEKFVKKKKKIKLFNFYWVQYIKSAKYDQIFFLFLRVRTIISDSIHLLSNQRLWNWVIENFCIPRTVWISFLTFSVNEKESLAFHCTSFDPWFSIFQYLRVERSVTAFLLRANGFKQSKKPLFEKIDGFHFRVHF